MTGRVSHRWSPSDLRFVAETLVPERKDMDRVVDALQNDPPLLRAMLLDNRLFRHLMSSEEAILAVTPPFFFKVLLLRAQREIAAQTAVCERRFLQTVVRQDAGRVAELLGSSDLLDYLAAMLASFTRTHTFTLPIRTGPGVWHRVSISDLDVDSLMRYAQLLDEEHRFSVYQRIADACLFLTGMFPELIQSHLRFPADTPPRARLKGSLFFGQDDYEGYGRTFYHLAARHSRARQLGLEACLNACSESFCLLERPIAFLSERYLLERKQQLFGI